MYKKQIISAVLLLLVLSTFSYGQREADLNQLMSLHRRAVGGIDALVNFNTARLEYDLSMDGKPAGKLEAWFGEEGYYREIIIGRDSWNSISYDGSYSYYINPSTRTARSPHGPFGNNYEAYYFYVIFSGADIFPLMNAEKRGADISLQSQASQGYSIVASYPNGAVRTFVLDNKMEIVSDTVHVQREGIRLTIQRRYSGYRNFGGTQLPGQIDITIQGAVVKAGSERQIEQKRSMKLLEARGGVDIDPDFFTPGFPASLAEGMTFDIDGVTFRFGGHVPAGDDPDSIKAADVNGDGMVDLVTADDGGVSLLLGEGNGTFPTRLGLPGGAGSNEYALPVDLDGDGRLDMAVASAEAPGDTLLLSRNAGNNQFESALQIEVDKRPVSIAAADFDGDGNTDLAVANVSGRERSDDVRVHFGDGKGGVARIETLSLTPDMGLAENVEAADINGDGSPDLLAVDQSNLCIFINAGDGSFAEPKLIYIRELPYCLAVADINADGNMDVIVGKGGIYEDTDSDDFALLYGNGDGTFVEPIFISAGACITGVEVADLNGDGAPDVVGTSFGTHEAVILMNDEGTLRHAGMLPCSWSPSDVALADLNGDGSIDIAVANKYGDEVTLWMNTAKGAQR